MKKYILPALCIVSLAQGMEEQITIREPREWDAKEYAQGNRPQEIIALTFLKKSDLTLSNKTVLDVGCGTGNISQKIAKIAEKVHGIDASKKMIKYAQITYPNSCNLTFEYAFAEDFTTQEKYDVGLAFNCIHWIENQRAAVEKINCALKSNGDFFGTAHTASDPESLRLITIREMIPMLEGYSFFKDKDILKSVSCEYPTDEEFKTLFKDTGFELISYEAETLDYIIKNREELEAIQYPILKSLPFVQTMPFLLREWFFTNYINCFLTKLTQNDKGHYIFPMHFKVFHARKIAEIQ